MHRSSLIFLLPLTLAFSGDEVRAQDQASSIQLALDLPVAARDLRRAGVPDPEIKIVLKSSRDKGLGAHEADTLVRGAERDVKERGPVDNFGAFVQSKLDEGLRGRELADAIHAEHEARGKGHGNGQGNGHDKHDDKHDDGKGHGNGHDKHDDKHDDHGKGHDKDDDKDKPDDRGGKPPEIGGSKPDDRGDKPSSGGGGGKSGGGGKAQSGGSRR